jgi:TolB-like protein/DNA-binding winged helix-turn-helix (wHTH) protein
MPTATRAERVRFGIFEADLRSGELYRQGRRIKLHQQPFQVLAMLLEHPGEVVTREKLRRTLWPADTFVNFDIGLNAAVRKLRQALHDSADGPRYVETLPRRGYRFIAPVANVATSEARSGVEVSGPEIEESVQPAFERATSQTASWAANKWIRWPVAGVALALLVFLAGLNLGNWRQRSVVRAAPVPMRSIAVLPLENLSGDPAQEYFVDGMTDALITNLAQISSLRVISRTSVMVYKGTRKRLPEIARELNVDGIVEGAVIRSGDRVRVDAQLVEAATDRHAWARTYERNLGEVISLQGEIARAVANEIQVKLTPEEHARLQRPDPIDPQTYELYIKGLYFFNRVSVDSSRKSIEYFQQAIQRHPSFAPAYAGMADAYFVGCYHGDAPEEACSKAKAEAVAALQLDETLTEAHTALAACLFWYDWNWAGAEKEFQRALALNPNYALAHQWYGQYQKAMGRKNWAAEVKRAAELDPVSPVFAGGAWYFETGEYDRAIDLLRKKLELDPHRADSHLRLGRAYSRKGAYADAINSFQTAVSLSGGAPANLSSLGYAYGMSDKRTDALTILRQLQVLSQKSYVSPYDIAVVYIGLGEKDRAFEWLDKAVAERSPNLVMLNRPGEVDRLRSDPRFAALKRRVGLPE